MAAAEMFLPKQHLHFARVIFRGEGFPYCCLNAEAHAGVWGCSPGRETELPLLGWVTSARSLHLPDLRSSPESETLGAQRVVLRSDERMRA